jgi:chromosome segregation ATPase
MAKRTKASATVIQNLLEEKRQIERWLRRLDMAGDKTPPSVRDKVRSDYGARREAILAELQGHRDALNSALKEHRGNRDRLAAAEDEATERLSEAELRHTVGEYDAAKWSEIRAEISEELVKVREELESAQAEIAQLEEVLDAIERPDAPQAEPEEPAEPTPPARNAKAQPEPEPEPEPEVEEPAAEEKAPAVAELDEVEEEAADEPAAAADTSGKSADEMAFLKSVISSDETASSLRAKPAPKKATAPADDEEPKRPAPKGSSKKTVKCTDCGTLNLPTEWYCEMCGAELTAL